MNNSYITSKMNEFMFQLSKGLSEDRKKIGIQKREKKSQIFWERLGVEM